MSIYDELGVKRYINAYATITILGGSIMPDEVIEAMKEASKSFVDIREFQQKAGDYIARLTHNEAAFIANSATAGILLCTAASIAGDDPEKRTMLPIAEGMSNEVILLGACHGYDAAVKAAGGKPIEIGDVYSSTAGQLEAAITDKTAAILVFYYQNKMDGHVPFPLIAKIAQKHKLPLLVDAAAQLPLKENLWSFTAQGADAAIFSGGKGLRGPQCSGLIVGKRNIIDSIAKIASPNQGVGRSMKIGKEEIAGLVTAVRLYMEKDEKAEIQSYETMVGKIVDAFKYYNGVEAARDFLTNAGQPIPKAKLLIKQSEFIANPADMNGQLKQEDPGLYLYEDGGAFYIHPQTLAEDKVDTAIMPIKKVLDKNRRK